MADDIQRLRQAARQLIEADRALAGEALGPGVALTPRATAAPASAPAVASQPAPQPTAAAAPQTQATRVPVPVVPEAPAGSPAAAKAAALRALEAGEVRNCRKCRLCQQRTQTVFGEGNPDAKLLFVGEGPGEEEDQQGRPFVGRSGELLTKQIRAMGLTRADVYIANVVKCRPPGNRAPATDEVAACWDYLQRQMTIIQPKVIVTLGNPSTHALLQTTEGITHIRGRWRALPSFEPSLAGVKVMPTYHPAYVLRSYTVANRQAVWDDLQAVMKELGLPLPAAKQPG